MTSIVDSSSTLFYFILSVGLSSIFNNMVDEILFSYLDRHGSPQKYYYEVSEYGIFNLIANHENLPSDTVKSLLLNHKDHVLFAFFLFPYLKEETIAQLYDSSMISRIFSYLHECCKRVDDMIHVINHTSNQRDGFITDQIFIWENVPGMESDTEGLRTFLQQSFGWNWLNKAEIKKSEDLNSIRISYGSDIILIRVDRTKRKATLSLRGKIECEFYIRNVLDQLIVEIPIRRLLSHHVLVFLISIQSRIPDFIFSLLSDYGPGLLHSAFEILGKDERFVNALKKAKNQFDKKYKLITGS